MSVIEQEPPKVELAWEEIMKWRNEGQQLESAKDSEARLADVDRSTWESENWGRFDKQIGVSTEVVIDKDTKEVYKVYRFIGSVSLHDAL